MNTHYAGGANHPRVDVERVGDPEADEIPWSPLPPGRFDGFQVMVRQLVGRERETLAKETQCRCGHLPAVEMRLRIIR
jgi:hypothetical protein